jgi:hypothetical protein
MMHLSLSLPPPREKELFSRMLSILQTAKE